MGDAAMSPETQTVSLRWVVVPIVFRALETFGGECLRCLARGRENEVMPLIADPEVARRIDVVSVPSTGDWGRWLTLPGDVIGTWHDDRVRVALGLVASLPESPGMRCFFPRYGMRVCAEWNVLTEVAFCFKCHKALVVPSEITLHLPMWFTFDPASAPAQELLRLFRSCE